MKNENSKISYQQSSKNDITTLLRICTVLLAAVSFWATAKGMENYVFDKGWQAYAASFAIQGILLGLNFKLPEFLKQQKGWIKKLFVILLTGVVLLSSSWFSYVYISDKAYKTSWPTESLLLAQTKYRESLYDANLYTELYSQELESDFGKTIPNLYRRASDLGVNANESINNVDFSAERTNYTGNNFAARDLMTLAISSLENASNNTDNTEIIDNEKATLVSLRETISQNINSINTQIATLQSQVDYLNDQIRTTNTDTENLITQRDNLNTRIIQLQNGLNDYQIADTRITYYETLLSGVSGTSYGELAAALLNIQNNLFKEDTNIDDMVASAVNVFNIMQGTSSTDDNNSEYAELLRDMNNFIGKLKNYQNLKKSHTVFEEKIETLENVSIAEIFELSTSSAEVSSNQATSQPNENTSSDDNTTQSGDNSSNTQNLNDKNKTEEKIKEAYNISRSKILTQVNDLKMQISKLPTYTDMSENKNLSDYNSVNESSKLDKVVRDYLIEHNSAQKAIVYISSPFWGLALLSMIIALFLDVSGFVTGMVIMGRENNKKPNDDVTNDNTMNDNPKPNNPFVKDQKDNESSKEETYTHYVDDTDLRLPKGLNHYVYFTGDFERIRGKDRYAAFENGREISLVIKDSIMESGLYKKVNKKYKPLSPAVTTKLKFAAEKGGPQDGIYSNVVLNYDHGMLTYIDDNFDLHYITNVAKDTTVFEIDKDSILVYNACELRKKPVNYVVVALNQGGSEVIAIYLM